MIKYPIGTRVFFEGDEGRVMGYSTNPYETEPYQYIIAFETKSIEYIRVEDIVPVILPSVEKSEHKGEITLDFTDLCPITLEPFVDGEEVIQLLRHSAFIYKRESLTEFWRIRPSIHPSTNLPVTQQSDITRWTVRIV